MTTYLHILNHVGKTQAILNSRQRITPRQRADLVYALQNPAYPQQIQEDAGQRLAVLTSLYQAQTDNALSSRYGITPDDKADFYQWCKTNHKGEMQDAVMKQLHSNQVAAWKPLADRYLAANAPSLAAFKAAGVPVRNGKVYLEGHWMTPQAAARTGLA